jgi:hypothetical protein
MRVSKTLDKGRNSGQLITLVVSVNDVDMKGQQLYMTFIIVIQIRKSIILAEQILDGIGSKKK